MSANYSRIGKICVVCGLVCLAGLCFVAASFCLQEMIVGWTAGRRAWAAFGFFPTSLLWLTSSMTLYGAVDVAREQTA